MSFALHSDPEERAPRAAVKSSPTPAAEIRRTGLEQLAACLESLTDMPDACQEGSAGLACRLCGESISHHFGRRSNLHFYRHARGWCEFAGKCWYGQTDEQARAAINS